MPCGRCRQLLWEHGGADMLIETPEGVRPDGRDAAPGIRSRRLETEVCTWPTHDAVEVISAKRDKGELSDSQIDWVIDAYTRGDVADEQMSALAMAILLNGMVPREIARWTAAMIASGERMDFSTLSRPTADKHSTGGVGRQDHPAAGAAGRGVRRRRTPAVGSRPRPHRRHPRQARVDPGLARAALQRGDVRPARVRRRGHLRGRRRARARRQEALRPARRDRHRRGDPADRLVDHVQEDRRGHRRAGARRQGRHRRLHEGRRRGRASSPRRWSASARTPACTRSRC